MNPTQPLYNPTTGMIATPNANVTADQQKSAIGSGYSFAAQSPITSASISNPQPYSIPTTTPTTSPIAGSNISATSDATTSAFTNLYKEEQAKADKAQATQATLQQEQQATIQKLLGKGQASITAEANAGIPDKTKALNEINNEALTRKAAYDRELQNIEKTFQGNPNGLTEASNALRRTANRELADIGIRQAVAQNDLTTAQNLVNRKIDLEYGDLKDLISYQRQFIEDNKEVLSKAEQNALSLKIKENEQQYEEKTSKLKSIENGKIDIFKSLKDNNAPASAYKAVEYAAQQPNASLESIYSAAGQTGYAGDSLKQLQIQKAKLDIEKTTQEIEAGKPLTGEWASVINGASGLVASTKQKIVKQNIANAISQGNYPTAYAEVANAVSDGITGSNKTRFDDARTDIGVMGGLRDAIENYVNAGGNVGFLKGTADTIAKNFGQLATDPKFASLAVQLQREFQAYRLGMTGAAFSPQESKEYAAVNPRGNASLDLNLATIDGAVGQLTNRVNSTIFARVPDAQRLWNNVIGSSVSGSTGGTGNTGVSIDDAYAEYLKATGQSTPTNSTNTSAINVQNNPVVQAFKLFK